MDSNDGNGSPLGWVVALGLLFLPGIIGATRGPPYIWSIALMQGTLLALPFAYLGMKGANGGRPWLVTIGLMMCFWAGPVAIAAVGPDTPGILTYETLLGLVMVASPFIAIAGARSAMRSTTRPDI